MKQHPSHVDPVAQRPSPPLQRTARATMRTLASWALALAWALICFGPAHAAPTPKRPASGKAGMGASSKPAPKPSAALVPLGASFTSADLIRVFVGNQAGVLKIYSKDKKAVLFVKDANGTDMVGVDGTQWAPLADKHRSAIFAALSISDSEVGDVARKILASYRQLPQPRNVVAVLGVIGSLGTPRLAPAVATEIRTFLSGLLKSEKDGPTRRQAVLALALCAETDTPTVKAVIGFMTASHNAWETFTTRQFFEYHKDFIRALPESTEIKRLLQASGNPYAPDIAQLLN